MSTTAGSGVEVAAIDTPTLGDRSYLAHDGDVAVVVDPQRDIDRVLDLAAARGVRITHVFETHLHNDYVTGGLALARATGTAVGQPGDWAGGRALRSYPVADFADLESVRHHRPVVILDVRRDSEWDDSHIAGAVHIPIHQLPARLGDVPEGEVWVHCQAGYRASVAASFLDAAGRAVVAVDDEFPRAARAGLPVDGHLAPAAAS
jgi:rhodanese-related sulfurtransferase